MKGPSICTRTLKRTPVASRMSAVRQLLETVASLHEAGIIHRDLNARNCMWGMTPIDGFSRSATYELLGRPLKQTIPFVDLWRRGELVSPIKVPDTLRTDEFYLSDFGFAKKISDLDTQRGYPPMHYCSPDRLHNQEPSFACYMWSYMAVFSMLYLTCPPFPTFINGGVVSAMVECLGRYLSSGKVSTHTPVDLTHRMISLNLLIQKMTLLRKLHTSVPMPIWSSGNMCNLLCRKSLSIRKTADPKKLLRDTSFKAIMERYGC
ncbi:unnamed protein product [Penicillium egyptiacum]|uniref:Protein kinase domain-containing protein n=1 Tax=Penicillium egyptiacum TaxID=1303716 RepID=A0A9W4KI58_9EURO|nr:unnamed protein product [Penicillium egyptiacum]